MIGRRGPASLAAALALFPASVLLLGGCAADAELRGAGRAEGSAASPDRDDAVSGEGVAYDFLIAGGHVVDGTGNPWFEADIGIRGDRIAAIGDLGDAEARRRIDATERVVAPGFIDLMAATDWQLLVDPRLPSKLTQGITTLVSGEGGSAAPLDEEGSRRRSERLRGYGVEARWRTLAEFFGLVEAAPPSLNYATFVGLGQLRSMVVGGEDRRATPEELRRMEALVDEAMLQGALGVSTALMYVPGRFADTEELVALSRAAASHGGIYATHQRSETESIDASMSEIFRINTEADIATHIFHLKLAGRQNWGRMDEIVARIDSARDAGLEVTVDVYPYTFAQAGLSALLPPWAREGSAEEMRARLREPELRERIKEELTRPTTEWENEYYGAGGAEGFVLTSALDPSLEPLVGKRLSEVARERGVDPRDVLMDIILAGSMDFISFIMDEPDVQTVIRQPWAAFCTDSPVEAAEGPLAGRGLAHPRAYGAFPRFFARYVRELGLLTLEDAVRKATSLPAQIVGLEERGLLREGFFADVVVFDPETIEDVSTYLDPHRYSRGIDHVLVNGRVVLDHGQITDARPGRVLRGPGVPRPE